MPDSRVVRMLQICPNDKPPFRELCAVYVKAARSIGLGTQTIVLAPPIGQPMTDTTYLDCETLSDNRTAAERLAKAAVDSREGLVICHRYRAYRVFQKSRLPAGRTVAVAHEFGFFKRWRRRVGRHLVGRGVLFAGVSDAVTRELAEVVGEAVTLPNVLDVEAVGFETREAARRALGLPADDWCCGVVGRLHYKKQPERALAAFAEVHTEIPAARLVFVGEGAERGMLEERSGQLPVSFLGFVENASRYVRAFDVLLSTSISEEAFGMVALEAMAAGVTVVAPRHPGPQSVLGDCAYYYDDPAGIPDLLKSLQRGDPMLEERRAAGVLRARQSFSVAALAARLDELRYDQP